VSRKLPPFQGRAVETRGGEKRPQLSDLRESGSIEQDADMVMFLYRPEYYGITADEQGNSVIGLGEVIIAKNRSGSLDTVPLRFIGKFTKYADFDGANYDSMPSFKIIDEVGSTENFEKAGAQNFTSKMRDLPPPSEFSSDNPADVPF
jgi:replicative DNA helicase